MTGKYYNSFIHQSVKLCICNNKRTIEHRVRLLVNRQKFNYSLMHTAQETFLTKTKHITLMLLLTAYNSMQVLHSLIMFSRNCSLFAHGPIRSLKQEDQ